MAEVHTLIPIQWWNSILTNATWASFEQDILTAAHERLLNHFEYGAMGFLLSDEDWAALPGNTDDNGVILPPPEVPQLIPPPQPSDGSAGDDRRYTQEYKERTLGLEARKEILEVRRIFKELLLNPKVVGAAHSVAVGAGDTLEKIAETPKIIFKRLKTHLGTPDAQTFEIWRAVYRNPADQIDVSEWIRQDRLAHTRLSAHGEQLSDAQRLTAFRTCYKNVPAVMTCWADYCKATPVLAEQNFINAITYVEAQEPNIRAALTRTQVGYPISPLAAVTVPASTLDAPLAGAALRYTQAQLDQAVADALARGRQSHPRLYCWLHGYNQSHAGATCRQIMAGRPLRSMRDSRPPMEHNRSFSHSGCEHEPPCISVEDARKAGGPKMQGQLPGNDISAGNRSQRN